MLKLIALFIAVVAVQASNVMYGGDYQQPQQQYQTYGEVSTYGSSNPIMPVYEPMPYGQRPSKCSASIDYTRVPGSCSKFRRCSNGNLYILRCPGNTVWDERLKTCNHKNQVPPPCGTWRPKPAYPSYPQSSYVQPSYPQPVQPSYAQPSYPQPVQPSYPQPTYQAPEVYPQAKPAYPVYEKTTTTTPAPYQQPMYPSYETKPVQPSYQNVEVYAQPKPVYPVYEQATTTPAPYQKPTEEKYPSQTVYSSQPEYSSEPIKSEYPAQPTYESAKMEYPTQPTYESAKMEYPAQPTYEQKPPVKVPAAYPVY